MSNKKVHLQVRNRPEYPYNELISGLKNKKFEFLATDKFTARNVKNTYVVAWTLWNHTIRKKIADKHVCNGGKVICMENAWVPSMRSKWWQFALRPGITPGINGSGVMPLNLDGGERWRSFGIDLKPWDKNGSHVLVCPQRGVVANQPDITHGRDWTEAVMGKIRALTDRPVLWRPHPGAPGKATLPSAKWKDVVVSNNTNSLKEDLLGAFVCVVYSSTSATEAIFEGVPVVYDGQAIMCHKLATRLENLENPVYPDREPILWELAHLQRSNEELSDGSVWDLV